jgi:hypothetical protein
MREILIRGGETEPSAGDLASAIREIYPPRTEIAASPTLGTRVILGLAAVALALPLAVMGGVRKRQHDAAASESVGRPRCCNNMVAHGEVFYRRVAAYGADQRAVGEARDRALIREIMDLAAAAEAVRNHGAVDIAMLATVASWARIVPCQPGTLTLVAFSKFEMMSWAGTVPSKFVFRLTLSSGARSRSR